jgi:hypothetical protein
MRTVNKVGGANGTIFTEFYGNTTDVKPTEDVPNGSAFYEVDNNMQEYRFDKENKIWYPITRGGTAPSDDYLPLSGGIMTGDINMNGNSLLNAKSITLKDETGEYTVALNLVHLETTNPETREPFSYEAIEFSNSDDTSKQYVITGVADPLSDTDVVNLRYLGNNYIPLTGTTEDNPVTGVVKFNGKSTITGVSTPVNDTDVVTKKYADDIKTELDDKTNQLNEDTTALQKRQNVLVGSETGNPVSCNDAFAAPLCGLNVYGKSTQDGTPSPDNPVPIVSAGDGGSVTVKVTGKNLLYISDGSGTNRGVTITAKNGLISISGTATENGYAALEISPFIISGVVILSSSITFPLVKLVSQTWKAVLSQNTANKMSDMVNRVVFVVTKGQTYNITGVKIQLELGTTATTYSPYRERLITLPTPNGLPGIPVTSGGNYTDPQGQQWVCDEVDLERGVKVQRVGVYKFYSSDGFVMEQVALGLVRFHNIIGDTLSADTGTLTSSALCSALPLGAQGSTHTQINVFTIVDTRLYINIENITSVNELQQYLQQTPMTLIALLATPIETPLTPAEIAAYKALTAYAPDTVVQASDGAGVKLEYQRDVNIVIKKFEDAIASMTTT